MDGGREGGREGGRILRQSSQSRCCSSSAFLPGPTAKHILGWRLLTKCQAESVFSVSNSLWSKARLCQPTDSKTATASSSSSFSLIILLLLHLTLTPDYCC